MIIAGPCSITTKESALRDAQFLSDIGVQYFRGGIFKPRTNPHSFQGIGLEGLDILNEIKKETKIKIVTEIVDIRHIPYFENVDIIQVGSRNCQNFELLKELAKFGSTVLLKRGFGMTVDEFIDAAEYLKEYGLKDYQIILCERGIKTFENSTRNTLDLSAVPILKAKTNYKIIVDPSHGTGRRDLVVPMSKAAIAGTADGLLIECTKYPDTSITDAMQTIGYDKMSEIVNFYNKYKNLF